MRQKLLGGLGGEGGGIYNISAASHEPQTLFVLLHVAAVQKLVVC